VFGRAHDGQVLLLALFSAACTEESSGSLRVPAPDAEMFEHEVYPVLLRDCGFPACHGAPERFFQVLGPGRVRASSETAPFDPALPEEIEHTYNRARSMLAHTSSVEEALLLRKPLSPAAGGAGHEGEDLWGRDVYWSAEAPGFQTLYTWARSALQGSAPLKEPNLGDAGAP
jgi:hypothetical protein